MSPPKSTPVTPPPTRSTPSRTWCWFDGLADPDDETTRLTAERGALYGDGLFETVLATSGALIGWGRHIERLGRGLAALSMSPVDVDRIHRVAVRLLTEADLRGGEAAIRVTITRGGPGRPLWPAPTPPHIRVTARRLSTHSAPRGITLATIPGPQRALPTVKSLCWLPSILALGAVSGRADEAVWADADGHVLEGATSNVFVWSGSTLVTPPLDGRILPGVARGVVLDWARAAGVTVSEAPLSVAALRGGSVFVTSALRRACPVSAVDGVPAGPPPAFLDALLADYDHIAARPADPPTDPE